MSVVAGPVLYPATCRSVRAIVPVSGEARLRFLFEVRLGRDRYFYFGEANVSLAPNSKLRRWAQALGVNLTGQDLRTSAFTNRRCLVELGVDASGKRRVTEVYSITEGEGSANRQA